MMEAGWLRYGRAVGMIYNMAARIDFIASMATDRDVVYLGPNNP